jgi:uncharacterized repeat protein (TIGR03803 family)
MRDGRVPVRPTQKGQSGARQRNLYIATGLVVILGIAEAIPAATLTTLASFQLANGDYPSSLILDGQGSLYGTTFDNLAADGAVFELGVGSSKIRNLALFNGGNGAGPFQFGALIADASGNYYGTTYLGGSSGDGAVFAFSPSSKTIVALASFDGSNGANPAAGLISDAAGNLYGTTPFGGASGNGSSYNGYGTVFELPAGSSTIKTLASFNGNNGAVPWAGLIFGAGGDLYGTTSAGGASGDGTVFELASGASTFTTLASFDGSNGEDCNARLISDAAGNFYGTATAGGANGSGTVFELAAGSGTITPLVSFDSYAAPTAGLVADAAGNLYGTTAGDGAYQDGTIFELTDTGFVVPEPSSLGVLSLVATVGLHRRRRREPVPSAARCGDKTVWLSPQFNDRFKGANTLDGPNSGPYTV